MTQVLQKWFDICSETKHAPSDYPPTCIIGKSIIGLFIIVNIFVGNNAHSYQSDTVSKTTIQQR